MTEVKIKRFRRQACNNMILNPIYDDGPVYECVRPLDQCGTHTHNIVQQATTSAAVLSSDHDQATLRCDREESAVKNDCGVTNSSNDCDSADDTDIKTARYVDQSCFKPRSDNYRSQSFHCHAYEHTPHLRPDHEALSPRPRPQSISVSLTVSEIDKSSSKGERSRDNDMDVSLVSEVESQKEQKDTHTVEAQGIDGCYIIMNPVKLLPVDNENKHS